MDKLLFYLKNSEYDVPCVLQVFEELLLDADWSVNAGSWMWLSCSSFFQQFFHCYCPVGFGRRTDPNGDFIRWVPFLASPLRANC